MSKILNSVKKFAAAEEGASLVEYALLVALIAVVCIAGMTALGGGINTLLSGLGTTVGNTATTNAS